MIKAANVTLTHHRLCQTTDSTSTQSIQENTRDLLFGIIQIRYVNTTNIESYLEKKESCKTVTVYQSCIFGYILAVSWSVINSK